MVRLIYPPASQFEEHQDSPYENEIAALVCFVKATTRLQASGGGAFSTLEHMLSNNYQHRPEYHKDQIVKLKARHHKNSDLAIFKCLDDYTELKSRISRLSDEQIQLLVNYYVFKVDAKALSSQLKIDVCSLGGKLSQARRKLAHCLYGLIPNRRMQRHKNERANSLTPVTNESDLLDERRRKVSRFLKKVLAETTPK